MQELTLNVYDKSGKKVVKTHKSTEYDLMFGTIMKLMKLLKIEDIDNQAEMLNTIYDAWDEIKSVLNEIFPDVSDDDWTHVKVRELLPLVISIAKYSISEMFSIPTNEKN